MAPGEAAIVDEVPSGRLVYDGRRLLSRDSPVLKGRQKLMYNGAVAVTLVLDERGALSGEPESSTVGLYEPPGEDADYAGPAVANAGEGNSQGRPWRTAHAPGGAGS